MTEKSTPLVKMVGVSKSFGAVRALKNVDLEIERKQIVGLLGDNGAGKSTLIKILVGLYPADTGEIYFEGKRMSFESPRDARDRGIEPVYQEMALVGRLNVWRNFFLGREMSKKFGPIGVLNREKMSKVSIDFLNDIGVNVRSPEVNVRNLSGGERQAIAIGRAMYFGAKLLILDEPTASLSIKEADKVLDYVVQAKEKGLSVIFITHNIYHVYPVADRFAILERGEKLGDYSKEEVTPEKIMKMISTGIAM
jgi:simple sugar transport system ATP-binding protein